MKLSICSTALADLDAEWLALGVFEGATDLAPGVAASSLGPILVRLLERKDVGTAVGDLTPILGETGLKVGGVLAFGLGKAAKSEAGSAFSAGVAVAKRLASKPREKVAVLLPAIDAQGAFIEGLIVGTKGADLRKAEKTRHEFGELLLVATADRLAEVERIARRSEIVGRAVNFARELVNTPPAEKPPAHLAETIRRTLADASADLEVEVWDESRIRAERFGGLLGVAAGSDQPPAFVKIAYRKGGDAPTTALIGKGVTFDSGGLSLKPSASMEDMKCDMSGAAIVASTLLAAARLGLPVNVDGYLALTENMTGGKAMKLGDVLTMRNGKTVEVMNTDAEGRLILADALSYAAEQKPARMLDLATLTGACLVALGSKVAGLFANDDACAAGVLKAAVGTGERLWRMPLDDDYFEGMKSPVADFKNVAGKWGGAITAAKFLQQFVGEIPWVHLDIAGPAWAESDAAVRDAGGTGCFVRTLIAWLEGVD